MLKIRPKTIAILCAAALVTACGKDEPGVGPDNNGGSDAPPVIDPNEQVADPEGTVTLSMRNENSGKTVLNDMYIDKADNFTGSYGWVFVNLGSMQGLGNVSYIPKSGYASKVSVTPGNGYVAVRAANSYYGLKEELYRLYVTGYTLDIAGQIIGAEVKYQEPFKGLDEALKADETALTFTNDGGQQSIVLNNATIIPFTIQSSAPWCRAVPSSTTDYSFLHDAVTIEVDEAHGADPVEATVTLTTGYGKELEIKVTRAGEKSFINLNTNHTEMSALAQTVTIGLGANLNASDISVSSDASWCTPTLTDNTDAVSEKAAKVKFIDGKPAVESRTGLNVTKSYNLNLAVTENGNDIPRRATVTLRSADGDAQTTLVVEQRGMRIIAEEYAEGVNVSSDGGQNAIWFNTDPEMPIEFEVSCPDSWCRPTFEYHEDYLSKCVIPLDVDANPGNTQRTTTVTVTAKGGTLSHVFTIIQDPVWFKIDNEEISDGLTYYYDRNDQTVSFTIASSVRDWEAESSADWCTLYKNGNTLNVMLTATTEDRVATISFKGMDYKFDINQSKYAVNDSYNEDGLTGTVGYIGVDGTRYIYQKVSDQSVWSTQTIETGANSHTDGLSNMNVIKRIPNWETLYPAFALCDALNTDGITGWYLPAMDELKTLKLEAYSGGYIRVAAWSSNEYSGDSAFFYKWDFNEYGTNAKTSSQQWGYYDYTIRVYAFHRF